VNVSTDEKSIIKSEREIANLAITRVSIFTIGIYSLYVVFATFTSSDSLALWQFAVAGVTGALYLGGYLYIRQTDSPVSFAPLLGFFIMVPLIVDHSAQNPWISNGLSCILMAIYMTGTGNKQVSYLSAGVIAVAQYVLAKAHLPSITDLSDIQYFGSYFSSLWILIVTVVMVRVRVEYLAMCDEMDNELDELRTRMFFRRQFLKRMNLRDYLNLQLHGTVLNSLLVLRNRAEVEGIEPLELKKVLTRDLARLDTSESIDIGQLAQAIPEQFHRLKIGDTALSIGVFDESNFSQFVRLQIIEIIRELVINAERHAGATSAHIELIRVGQIAFELRVSENSIQRISPPKYAEAARASMSSKSIMRLTKGLAGRYSVRPSEDSTSMVHVVGFSPDLAEKDPVLELKRLRYGAIEVILKHFLRMSVVYGLSITPGLFIKGVPTTEKIIFAISVASGAWAIFAHRFTAQARWISSVLALSILPILEFHATTCSSIPALAWMFNGMLGSIFLVSSKTDSRLLRWLPGFIFLFESILTSFTLPHACNRILAGSTPGIIFILTTAFLAGRLRNRNLEADAQLSRQTESDETNVGAVERLVSLARQDLVSSLEKFGSTFNIPSTQRAEQVHVLNLEIQKIRAFLLCSEYFEYEASRQLYRWILKRIEGGNELMLNILGEGRFQVDPATWDESLARLESVPTSLYSGLTILNTEQIELGIRTSTSHSDELAQALIQFPLKIIIEVN